MTIGQPDRQQLVIFCRCAHYDIIAAAAREQILNSLSRAGLEVEVVDDLCGLAAHRDRRLQSWVRTPSLAVVACFPRAIRWLFHAAGAPISNEGARFFNMRTQPPEQIIGELMRDNGLSTIDDKSAASAAAVNHRPSIINHQSDWVPWFPVIDYEHCQNCKQCFNFCLFGVYGLSPEGRVEVCKPAGCKTNCPACARMCPQKAIIFPKYGDAPINGDEVPQELIIDNGLFMIGKESASSAASANQQSSINNQQSAAPAGDILDRIRQRAAGHKRFSVGATPRGCPNPSGQAQGPAPTRSCPTLNSLRKELGVPDDVLNSLSSTELARIRGKSQPGGPEKRQGGTDDEVGGRKKEHHG